MTAVPRTPSFHENGVEHEVSMELVGGITPMAGNRTKNDEVRKEVEMAYLSFGQGYRHLKSASLKLGINVPPTPRGGSTPFRVMTPIGRPPVDSWRLTPGGESRPILPMGLPGTETMQNGNVWMDFKNPPPGYPVRSPSVTATTTATPSAATTTATSSATSSTTNWDAGKDQRMVTGNWQGGKDLRTKLNKKLSGATSGMDGSKRLGWRREDMEGQRRQLGGRCSRCFGKHKTSECTFHPEELRCRYPPCKSKIGHVTSACHELTKICILPICKGARGHRSFCHDTVPVEGGKPYGYTEAAAKALKEDFIKFRHLLTDEDMEEIAVAEGVGYSAQNRGGGPVGRGRGRLGGRSGGPYDR